MNLLIAVCYLCVITLGQAQNNYKDVNQEQTNQIINKAEMLQIFHKLFGETKIDAQFYAIKTDTKWAGLKQDKEGLLMKMLQNYNKNSMKDIRINNKLKSTNSAKPTTTVVETKVSSEPENNNHNKMPLNQNDYYKDSSLESSESETKKNHYDYFSSQVAIFSWPVNKNDAPICAGSLISNRYVLTTADCLVDTKKVVVKLGARNFPEAGSLQFKIDSSNFIIHEKWNSTRMANNIALIRLPEPVEFNANIFPANLPTKADETESFTNYNATLVGWFNREAGISSYLLKATDVIISNAECFLTYRSLILPSNICLASTRSKSSCIGENGDQLLVEDVNGLVKLIGVLTFAMQNGCENNQPVVFTRVSSYLGWIKSHAEM